MKKRYIITIAILIALAATAFALQSERPDPSPDRPASTEVTFYGDIAWNGSFHMTGTLERASERANISTFEDVSVRLYDAEGTLLTHQCIGNLSETDSIDISFTSPVHPEYVIFHSPDFWNDQRVHHFSLDFHSWNREEYVREPPVRTRSSLPVDVDRHETCS